MDEGVLAQLSAWFSREIEECRAAVYASAGVGEFNLNSPKQLGEVLFDKLDLPRRRKRARAATPPLRRCWRGWRPIIP